MSLVRVDGLRKRFGDNEVLKGINLKVEAGQVVAIVGKSGSGKSTLLRCVNGLETYDDGRIAVDGIVVDDDATALRKLRQTVGMVFQQFNLFPHLSAGRNVMLAPMVVKKMAAKEAAALARDCLTKVGLAEKFDAYPEKLSGGQQQRVAIARTLAMAPKIILCDEITSALDPELVGEVLKVVQDLAEQGMTLIMVTHEMGFAREVGDMLVFMHQGKVHETGVPAALFDAPKTPELRQFLGAVL
jgi:polar amino acid transport system ATP-binding protein